MSEQTTTLSFIANPGDSVSGDITIPGDKSISHRSIMFGSMADGITHVSGFLPGEDCLATMKAFKAMGVNIEGPDANNNVIVHGVGIDGLKQSTKQINIGNSGTSIRLMSGILAGQSFASTMAGDSSLNKRPMMRVVNPLKQMGAKISAAEDGTPPISVEGGSQLTAIDYELPMASAQVKSCVLLAGLFAEGTTTVTEPGITRDHTERMLQAFGYEVTTTGNKVSLTGGGRLTACDINVPGDISSATFFIIAGLIAKQGSLTLRNVGMNPTRIGVLNIVKQMGANIEIINERKAGAEPVADLIVHASDLVGIDIKESDVPLAIDEFPAIFIAAACAKGLTRLRNAEELRVKESDRIQAMADGLEILGVDCVVVDDGIDINGGPIGFGTVDSQDDHRIAMAFAISSLRASGTITILDCENVATSFPSFVRLANEVGLNVAAK